MNDSPLLLTRKQAKAVVGVDPYAVCPPMHIGARLYWYLPTLKTALDAMAVKAGAIIPPPPPLPTASGASEDVEAEIERTRKRIAKGAASGRK